MSKESKHFHRIEFLESGHLCSMRNYLLSKKVKIAHGTLGYN